MAETSTIFGFMKYVSATDILSDFKKTVDSHFVNSLKHYLFGNAFLLPYFRKDGDVMANYKSSDEKTKQAFEMIEQGVKDVYSSDSFVSVK